MNKYQTYESCENFVNLLYANYPRLFKSLNEIILQYQNNPSMSKTFISQSLLNLLKDNPNLESQLYELLSPPIEITKPYTLENVQNQITEAFQMIQNKKPEKMMNLIGFFQEKTQNQANEKDAFEIRSKALDYFKEFFKDEANLFKEIAQCFEFKETKKAEIIQEKIDLLGSLQKKRKLDNFKEKIIVQTPKKDEITTTPLVLKSMKSMNNHHFLAKTHSALAPEEIFFMNLKGRLTESQTNFFFKVFFLYLENILSNHEMFEQVAGLFPNESEFLCLRNLVLSKEVAHRKAALYFKPFSDMDLSSSF